MKTFKILHWIKDGTAEKKIAKLSPATREHLIFQIDQEIKSYLGMTDRYSREKYEKCSVPHIEKYRMMQRYLREEKDIK